MITSVRVDLVKLACDVGDLCATRKAPLTKMGIETPLAVLPAYGCDAALDDCTWARAGSCAAVAARCGAFAHARVRGAGAHR